MNKLVEPPEPPLTQTHFSPEPLGEEIHYITIIITLEIVENIKTKKQIATIQFEGYFFHQRCKKVATTETL